MKLSAFGPNGTTQTIDSIIISIYLSDYPENVGDVKRKATNIHTIRPQPAFREAKILLPI